MARQTSTVVMVNELAGPDDYWLTLTDAAYITRRQEVASGIPRPSNVMNVTVNCSR